MHHDERLEQETRDCARDASARMVEIEEQEPEPLKDFASPW